LFRSCVSYAIASSGKRPKGIPRRIVQIAKRHRDMHFIDDDEGLAPLSIIITTLASHAYEFCVNQFASIRYGAFRAISSGPRPPTPQLRCRRPTGGNKSAKHFLRSLCSRC
jgi:hypothetical protein